MHKPDTSRPLFERSERDCDAGTGNVPASANQGVFRYRTWDCAVLLFEARPPRYGVIASISAMSSRCVAIVVAAVIIPAYPSRSEVRAESKPREQFLYVEQLV
jgi:hypothetical protein